MDSGARIRFEKLRDKYVDAASYEKRPRKSLDEAEMRMSDDEQEKKAEYEGGGAEAPESASNEDSELMSPSGRPSLALQARLLSQFKRKLGERAAYKNKGKRALTSRDKPFGALSLFRDAPSTASAPLASSLVSGQKPGDLFEGALPRIRQKVVAVHGAEAMGNESRHLLTFFFGVILKPILHGDTF